MAILTYKCDDCEETFDVNEKTVVITGTRTVCRDCYDKSFDHP